MPEACLFFLALFCERVSHSKFMLKAEREGRIIRKLNFIVNSFKSQFHDSFIGALNYEVMIMHNSAPETPFKLKLDENNLDANTGLISFQSLCLF